MSEPRRVVIGVLPSGADVFIDGADPVARLIAEAGAKLDQQRANEARALRRQGRRRRARKEHETGARAAEVGPGAQNVSETGTMTLATLHQPSAARSRVEYAAELLRAALTELHGAAREEDRERERAALDAQAAERARRAEAETRRRSRTITLDRGWAEKFGDGLREVAHAVSRRGERSHADQLGRLIEALREELEKPEKAAR
jgi:hypothetical protein